MISERYGKEKNKLKISHSPTPTPRRLTTWCPFLFFSISTAGARGGRLPKKVVHRPARLKLEKDINPSGSSIQEN